MTGKYVGEFFLARLFRSPLKQVRARTPKMAFGLYFVKIETSEKNVMKNKIVTKTAQCPSRAIRSSFSATTYCEEGTHGLPIFVFTTAPAVYVNTPFKKSLEQFHMIGIIDSACFEYAAKNFGRAETIAIFDSIDQAAHATKLGEIDCFLTNDLYAGNVRFFCCPTLTEVAAFMLYIPPGNNVTFTVFKAAPRILPTTKPATHTEYSL
jgi:hypothetical protein